MVMFAQVPSLIVDLLIAAWNHTPYIAVSPLVVADLTNHLCFLPWRLHLTAYSTDNGFR